MDNNLLTCCAKVNPDFVSVNDQRFGCSREHLQPISPAKENVLTARGRALCHRLQPLTFSQLLPRLQSVVSDIHVNHEDV